MWLLCFAESLVLKFRLSSQLGISHAQTINVRHPKVYPKVTCQESRSLDDTGLTPAHSVSLTHVHKRKSTISAGARAIICNCKCNTEPGSQSCSPACYAMMETSTVHQWSCVGCTQWTDWPI